MLEYRNFSYNIKPVQFFVFRGKMSARRLLTHFGSDRRVEEE
jgi:hypothetical protein